MVFGMAKHGENRNKYLAAEMLLKGSGLNMLDAASLAVELLSLCGGRRSMRRARKAIFLGAEELRKGEKTVSFSAAVEETLRAKRGLRPTTLRDIRYFTGALMRRCPELKDFPVRKLTPERCARFLETAFSSRRQRYKGRAVMSGVLSLSLRRGWCGENPIVRVEPPAFRERTIAVLVPEEIKSLREVVEIPEFRDCAPAVWVMLYAGIRPGEVMRLRWSDVDMEERVISVRSVASKTGGVRHVTIHAVLRRLLAEYGAGERDSLLCPPNWPVRWRLLRKKAGWGVLTASGNGSADASEAYLCFLSCQVVPGFSPASDGDGAPLLLPAAGAVPEHGGSEPRQGTPVLGSAGTRKEKADRALLKRERAVPAGFP